MRLPRLFPLYLSENTFLAFSERVLAELSRDLWSENAIPVAFEYALSAFLEALFLPSMESLFRVGQKWALPFLKMAFPKTLWLPIIPGTKSLHVSQLLLAYIVNQSSKLTKIFSLKRDIIYQKRVTHF